MPSNYEVADSSNEPNPMLGLIGFIVMLVVGGISYALSNPIIRYVTRAKVTLGAAQLLPVHFPPEWSDLTTQLVVTFTLFLVLFVISMIILFMFMKPRSADERSVNLDDLRKEVQERKKR